MEFRSSNKHQNSKLNKLKYETWNLELETKTPKQNLNPKHKSNTINQNGRRQPGGRPKLKCFKLKQKLKAKRPKGNPKKKISLQKKKERRKQPKQPQRRQKGKQREKGKEQLPKKPIPKKPSRLKLPHKLLY